MSNSFMRHNLPPRSYGIMMPVNTMTRVAKEATNQKGLTEERVDLIIQSLMRCKLGEKDSGVLRLLVGRLDDGQLDILEGAVLTLQDKQSRHEDWYKDSSGIFPIHDADWGPFDHIVNAVLPEFDEIALIALRDFSTAHHNLRDLTRLCKIMDEQGIPLTQENVAVQIVALIEATHNRRELFVLSHTYLSYPELILAVHNHPEHAIELVELQRTRGSVKAASEVVGSAKAVSEGAL